MYTYVCTVYTYLYACLDVMYLFPVYNSCVYCCIQYMYIRVLLYIHYYMFVYLHVLCIRRVQCQHLPAYLRTRLHSDVRIYLGVCMPVLCVHLCVHTCCCCSFDRIWCFLVVKQLFFHTSLVSSPKLMLLTSAVKRINYLSFVNLTYTHAYRMQWTWRLDCCSFDNVISVLIFLEFFTHMPFGIMF
jgi:hypothetical protein